MSGTFRNIAYESSSGDDLQPEEDEGEPSEVGIGIALRQQKGNFFVDRLDPGGAGERSGAIKVSQKILSVEGISVYGKKQQEVMDLLLGPADTLVEIEIEDPSAPGKRHGIVVRRLARWGEQDPSLHHDAPCDTPPSPKAAEIPEALAHPRWPQAGRDDGAPIGASARTTGSEPLDRNVAIDKLASPTVLGKDGWEREQCGSRGRQDQSKGLSAARLSALEAENGSLREDNRRLADRARVLQEERDALAAEAARLREEVAELSAARTGDHEGKVAEEASIDPSEYVGASRRRRKSPESAHEEDSFDPSEYYGGAPDDGISEASFDPSEWEGGGDSESEGGEGGTDNCGVGITLVEGTDGFRVISLTHAGPADRSGKVRVGDVVTYVGSVNVCGRRKHEVLGMLKGQANTKVLLTLKRGQDSFEVALERDEAEQRVWRMLSQYSQLHPEDFGGISNPASPPHSSPHHSSPHKSPKAAEASPVDSIKMKLDRQNEEIQLLKAHLAEAQTGKEGMLDRINQLLNRAQETDVKKRAHLESPKADRSNKQGPSSNGSAPPGTAWPGVLLDLDEDSNCRIADVVQGTPAHASRKVHVGDSLMTVEGVPAKGKSMAELEAMVCGIEGTSVVMGLQRTNAQGLLYLSHVALERVPRTESVPSVFGSPAKEKVSSSSPAKVKASQEEAARQRSGESEKENQRCSVGLLVKRDSKGNLKVRGFATGGPAERSGKIKVGQQLISVNGAAVKGLHFHQLADLFLGENGSIVVLALQECSGDKAKTFEVSLTREPHNAEAVSSTSNGRVRRIDAAIDPVAAENALKNAEASAAARMGQRILEEQENQRQTTWLRRPSNAVYGVGIKFALAGDDVVVEKVASSSQAARAALLSVGDTLLSVDGRPVKGLGLGFVNTLVHGDAGGQVHLSMRRRERGLVSILLTREVPVTQQSPEESMDGVPCGVGITFKLRKDGQYHVKAIADGGPAACSGKVNLGDIVIRVGGAGIQGLSHEDLAKLVLGEHSTQVDLTILKRAPSGIFVPTTVTLLRAAIPSPSIPSPEPPYPPATRSQGQHSQQPAYGRSSANGMESWQEVDVNKGPFRLQV